MSSSSPPLSSHSSPPFPVSASVSTRSGSYYQLGSVIGVGTYGEVRYGVLSSTNEHFALKIVEFARYSAATQALLKREIEILRELDHEYCIGIREIGENIPLKGRFCDQCACTQFLRKSAPGDLNHSTSSSPAHSHSHSFNSFTPSDSHSPLLTCAVCGHSGLNHSPMETRSVDLIVQELAVGGEMFGIISQTGPLTEDFARYYFKQMVQGVEYLHKRGVYHRDLKLENITLSPSFSLKIIDFGLAATRKGWKKGRKSGHGMNGIELDQSSDSEGEQEQFQVDEDIVEEEPMFHTGVGCVEAATNIRLSSGAVKRADQITCDDLLVDPDGKPQRIESIESGRARYLYEIRTKLGIYAVTLNHQLALKYKPNPENQCWIDQQMCEHFGQPNEEPIDSSLCPLETGSLLKVRVFQFLRLSAAARAQFTSAHSDGASFESPLTVRQIQSPDDSIFHYIGIKVSHPSHLLTLGSGELTGNSLPYASPEVFYREVYQHQPYNAAASDVWSMAVILFILLHAKPPFLRSLLKSYGLNYKRDKHFIAFMRGEGPIAHTPDTARDLIQRMMKLDPAERLTIQQIKDHPFYRGPVPDDETVSRVMEERAIKTWTAAENVEMLTIMKEVIAEQRNNANLEMMQHSAAIPIPRSGAAAGAAAGVGIPGKNTHRGGRISPPFSLMNPASLPSSFAVSPSFSLHSGSQSAEDYLAQHERARAAARRHDQSNRASQVQASPVSNSLSIPTHSPDASPLTHAMSGIEIDPKDTEFGLEPIPGGSTSQPIAIGNNRTKPNQPSIFSTINPRQ